MKGSAKVLIKQVRAYSDDERRLAIAKAIIMAAMHNMRANIRYYMRRRPNQILKETEQKLTQVIVAMNETKTVEELMLTEARGRQVYYKAFPVIIANEDFAFEGRTKRPPRDAINSLISFGNTILYNRIASEIHKSRLDIRISFLHSANNRRESLNLDIAEIFKPVVVDRAIFTTINRGELDCRENFEENPDDGGIYLSGEGKRIFLGTLDRKLLQKVTVKGSSITYDALIKNEIRKLQRHIEQDEKYTAYKYY